jgi:REP element-mobilizing transposase RayT
LSQPRQVLPGTTYLVSRRCAQRQFLLRPSRRVNHLFRFCLAFAAQRTGVQLHAYCVLSNHYHLVLTDPNGNLPEFMHWLNEYVAKAINALLGRWEALWAPGSYSAVRLVDSRAVLRELVYLYTNPVEAGLVRRARDWPGVHSLPSHMTAPPMRIRRSPGFFRDNGPVAGSAELELSIPPALIRDLDDAPRLLERMVREREKELQQQVKARGSSFFGRKKVLRQSPWGRPDSPEPRRGLNPRIACRDKWKRIETLQRLKEFVAAYREARQRYLAGMTDVRFPVGTYWMRVRLGVLCSGP